MLSDYFDRYAARHEPYKGGPWCYEDGLVYVGLTHLHRATGEDRWLNHAIRMIDAQIEDGPALRDYVLSEYNIDNIQPGRALLYLHRETGQKKYLQAAEILARQLQTQPRTRSGVYWHKLRYPWQIWLDGLYMCAPFQIGYGQATDQPELVRDYLDQIAAALKDMAEPALGLYCHAFDEAREQDWADPVTGHSRAYWSRALGWLAMCLVETAELVGPAAFKPLQKATSAYLEAILRLRQPGGLWLQVIDRKDMAANYQEASASAMFVYALRKGQHLGLIDGVPGNLHNLLIERTVRKAAHGGLEMYEICEVAGLGRFGTRYRDGSAEYYLSEKRVADDPKGVAPLMKCVALDMELNRTPVGADV